MEEVPVFRPTMAEFCDFAKFVASIKDKCKKTGICKVIPPPEWKPTKKSYESSYSIVIPNPIQQIVTGKQGVFQQMNIESKQMTVEKFKEQAERVSEEQGIKKLDPEMRERKFWKTITFSPPLYGADMLGSLFDEDLQIWNLQKLDSILNLLGTKIPGITEPYLYFGMWKAMFSWHTEDMDLYSINYLHYGEPKTWYAIPSSEKAHFERIAQQYFPDEYKECRQFLRHKMSMISPMLLVRQFNLPVSHCIQYAGEFVITQPGAYHAGFNHGFNCAESVNFAIEDWIDFGRVAKRCTCQSDTVRIDMDLFLQKYYESKGLVYQVPIRRDDPSQNPDGDPTAPPKKKRGRPAKPKLFPIDPKPVIPGPPRKRGRPRKYPLPDSEQNSPQPKKIRLNVTLSQQQQHQQQQQQHQQQQPSHFFSEFSSSPLSSSNALSAPHELDMQQSQHHIQLSLQPLYSRSYLQQRQYQYQYQHQQQSTNTTEEEVPYSIQKNVILLPHEQYGFESSRLTTNFSLDSITRMPATPECELLEKDDMLDFSSSTGSSSFENETEHDFDNENEIARQINFKQNVPSLSFFETHVPVPNETELVNCTTTTSSSSSTSTSTTTTNHSQSSQHTTSSQEESQQLPSLSPPLSHPPHPPSLSSSSPSSLSSSPSPSRTTTTTTTTTEPSTSSLSTETPPPPPPPTTTTTTSISISSPISSSSQRPLSIYDLTTNPNVTSSQTQYHPVGDHFSEQPLFLISPSFPIQIGHLSDFIDHLDHSSSFSAFVLVNNNRIL